MNDVGGVIIDNNFSFPPKRGKHKLKKHTQIPCLYERKYDIYKRAEKTGKLKIIKILSIDIVKILLPGKFH